MGSFYDTLYESLDIGFGCNFVDSINMMRPTKYKNPKFTDKTYTLCDNDVDGPYVKEERSDGYKTKLRMSKDRFYQFQSFISQNGWIKV